MRSVSRKRALYCPKTFGAEKKNFLFVSHCLTRGGGTAEGTDNGVAFAICLTAGDSTVTAVGGFEYPESTAPTEQRKNLPLAASLGQIGFGRKADALSVKP